MAALDSHEQEQLEAMKAWWQDNRNWIVGVLLAAIVVVGGWRGWSYYQHKQGSEAATLFQQFSEQMGSGDAKRINDAAAAMMEKFSGSAYASRAALMAALVNEQMKDAATAKTQLQWVIDNAGEEGLKDMARLRLAAVLLDEKNYAEALKQLEAEHMASFDGLYADLRGDILNAQGKKDEARSAYTLAFEKIDERSMYRNLIQIKLDALGVAK
jgi:predicted negative regulator of RcsB-dependent stress response